MRCMKLGVAVGLVVSLSACGTDVREPVDRKGEEVPVAVAVEEVAELQESGASLTAISGTVPLVVRDSVRLGIEELEPGGLNNETLGGGVNALSGPVLLNEEGMLSYSGGLFGTSYDLVLGNWCRYGHVRDYAVARKMFDHEKGWCTVRRWVSDDPYDCRIVVHIGARPFEAGTCLWQTYSHEQ